jgi:LysM repeat protein
MRMDGSGEETFEPPPAESTASAPLGPEYYIVRPGDTLRAITDFFGVHPDDLIALNGLAPGADLIPGSLLRIPPPQP